MRLISLWVVVFQTLIAFGQEITLTEAAIQLTEDQVTYDPTYFSIPYPMGDVPADKGVCTDVIVRAYRKVGIDLQQLVHEDMKANFERYPQNWGLSKPDPNIDHRRVPNLMTFFKRFGETKAITANASDYLTGDIVCWDLGQGINHIGIVIASDTIGRSYPLIVHNIGAGQVIQDFLFQYPIIGHFRYQ